MRPLSDVGWTLSIIMVYSMLPEYALVIASYHLPSGLQLKQDQVDVQMEQGPSLGLGQSPSQHLCCFLYLLLGRTQVMCQLSMSSQAAVCNEVRYNMLIALHCFFICFVFAKVVNFSCAYQKSL